MKVSHVDRHVMYSVLRGFVAPRTCPRTATSRSYKCGSAQPFTTDWSEAILTRKGSLLKGVAQEHGELERRLRVRTRPAPSCSAPQARRSQDVHLTFV